MHQDPTQPSTPLQRYRAGHTGLKWLNGHLAPLGIQAVSAWFDKSGVSLHCEGPKETSHQLVPASPPRGPNPQPANAGATSLVPCKGVEPGKPRPETPFPVPFSALLKRLFEDGLIVPASPDFNSPQGRLDRFFRTTSHARDWWKFHYPQNRLHCLETRMGPSFAKIHHSSLECYRAYFRFLPSLERFNDEPFRPPTPRQNFATLLTYQDALTGRTQARLEQTIEQAASEGFEGLLVRTTCVPDMVGDSPVHLLQHLEAQKSVQGHWVAKTHPTPDAIALILKRRLETLLNRPAQNTPCPVLLAGPETEPLANEFAALLAPLGITVVENLLPNLQLQDAQGRGSPVACIWTNSYGWDELLTEQLLPLMPVVRPFPPYGLAATTAWLTRIVDLLAPHGVLSHTAQPRQIIDQLADSCAGRLEPIRKQAAAIPVALVGDKTDLALLAGRSPYSGFSVLALLRELGFPVSLLLFDPTGKDAAASAGSPPIRSFASAEELKQLLAEFPLAYTDFAVDPRLLASGTQGFGAGCFDPGYEGLVRAGHLLIHRAQHAPLAAWKKERNSLWSPKP